MNSSDQVSASSATEEDSARVLGVVVGAGAGVDVPAAGSARAQLTVVSINGPAWQSS
ncbi:hypothetical protein ACIQOV_20150 [Kitasatospora sp. NPDC091257]|uniref:hypothetical protein n=1 Tax=Kitasatospora sp. NPDC091257 TaxID=3364084 RepID=UPI003826815A